jgi:hypothetical protein
MSIVDTAITRLQAIAMACTDVTIKAAPDKMSEDAFMLPMSLCYISGGTGSVDDRTTARLLLTVNVDIHFSRLSLKQSYTQMQALIPEYLKRLAGDPTLAGSVDTINFPVTVLVSPYEWNLVVTEMVRFIIPLKFLQTPTVTA